MGMCHIKDPCRTLLSTYFAVSPSKMSCGGMHATQAFFLHSLSDSWVFPFCGVPFNGMPFLGVSSDLFVALSPWSFPCLEECFLLLMGLFVFELASLAPVGGFSVTVCALWWGLATEPEGGGTLGDFFS